MPTKIEWTDDTWNPVTGCTNISPGCDNCYAEKITQRFKTHPWNEVTLHPDRIKVDPRWKPGQRIFVCSMGDLFHSAVPFEFIAKVFAFMQAHQEYTFQVLTKRPGRMMHFANVIWPNRAIGLGDELLQLSSMRLENNPRAWPSNVWAGTSVESEKYAARLDLLLQVPAPIRFVSYEPALEAVDFRPWLPEYGGVCCAAHQPLHWVIAGGESGLSARPANPDWFRAVRDQCEAAGVPFFFKQWGEWGPEWMHVSGGHRHHRWDPEEPGVLRVGKKAAGLVLDGREWREFPEVVRN